MMVLAVGRNMSAIRAMILLIGLAVLAVGSVAPAEEVAPGITFTSYDAPGPNRVHIVTVDRLRSEYKLKVGWPQKQRNYTARQTVSTIASLYDAPPAHDVVAAVNASFFGTVPSITGAAASDGEMLDQPDSNYETFLFGPTRLPMIRADIGHVNGKLTFADGSSTTLHSYNKARDADTIVAYTPQWAPTTGTIDEGVEVMLADVSYPMRSDKAVAGVVTAIETGAASVNNAIPAGGMVLSAVGTPVATITSKVQAGDRLTMFFDTSDGRWNNADMAITGIGWLLDNGAANTANWAKYAYSTQRHPRTALAWNDEHLYLMVCDGRCNGIVGMTFQEMADFLIGTLGATDAVNLDGGGSSTMWVNGQVRNLPSDNCGTERAVGNAILLVRQDTSTAYPLSDSFADIGRLAGWDDKFTFNGVQVFSPASPGGDGYAIQVQDPAGGVETVRRGDFGDTDYAVQSDIYCEYRPGVAGNGFERYCIFARDNGMGALGLNGNYGSGNCYALTYDSNNGRLRAAKYVNGTISDFQQSSPVYMASTAWRNFRIECLGSRIRYLVDGSLLADVIDTTHVRGYFGIGYHEFFATNSNMHGTRADNFSAVRLAAPDKAADPEPANFTTDVPLVTVLSWAAGAGAVSHDVYFGTTSPGTFQGNQAAATFDPGLLQLGQTYYWRVDEVNAYGTTTGDTWSFTARQYKGDFDNDGDLDQMDFGLMQACLSGASIPQLDAACQPARFDNDSDVDQVDIALFLDCLSGPLAPMNPDCLDG